MVRQILGERGVDEDMIHAICSHGYGLCSDVEPERYMEKVLYTIDEWTGLINAGARMRPSHSVMDMELKSVKKKFKQPSFAAGVNRGVIEDGCQRMGASLDEVIKMCIRDRCNAAGRGPYPNAACDEPASGLCVERPAEVVMVDHKMGHAAVDAYIFAGNESSLVRRQEKRHVGYVHRIAHASNGLLVCIRAFIFSEVSIYPARRYGIDAVSYTHLDVYKRQSRGCMRRIIRIATVRRASDACGGVFSARSGLE